LMLINPFASSSSPVARRQELAQRAVGSHRTAQRAAAHLRRRCTAAHLRCRCQSVAPLPTYAAHTEASWAATRTEATAPPRRPTGRAPPPRLTALPSSPCSRPQPVRPAPSPSARFLAPVAAGAGFGQVPDRRFLLRRRHPLQPLMLLLLDDADAPLIKFSTSDAVAPPRRLSPLPRLCC
uniref:Uncharacterized protein n=1 Tax=Aegilops tauschii subsp. strangulata TaxID=200361 RepID=A0A453BH49_AEGTS